jgi:hypothetical protein
MDPRDGGFKGRALGREEGGPLREKEEEESGLFREEKEEARGLRMSMTGKSLF